MDLSIDSYVSPEVLADLAVNGNRVLRYDVACHPNTPLETLELLAADDNANVRWWVAENPNTPHRTKKYLKIQEHLARL
jgi:hypothetical protein